MIARPASRRLALTLGALATVLALAGCDLRLEGAAPAAPTPGAAEQVRERTVADALDLAAAARAAEPVADKGAAAVLEDVATFSEAHAAQLGGTYDSGLPEPTTSTTTPAAVVATPDDVLAALRADAATALTDATAAGDGATARLLAAVGVSRDQLASRLGTALNEPVPTPTPTPTATVPEAAPVPTDSPTSSAGDLTSETIAPLVLAHDQAGFGLEVVAAKSSGDQRTAAARSSAEHRGAAESWAQRVGIAGTANDPRRAVYALPANVDDPAGARALAASLEAGVAEAASAAILSAPADVRTELIGELSAATTAAAGWGATPTAFPGIPDLA
jgi:hypothetical protein